MDFRHRNILESNRWELVNKINLRDGLFTQLRSEDILNERHESRIRHSGDPFRQVELMLDYLLKRPAPDYLKFRECLRRDDQGHVVDLLLPTLDGVGFECGATNEPSHAVTLRRHRVVWIKQLEEGCLIDHVIAANVLDYRQRETLAAKQTRFEKITYLLDCLEGLGVDAYNAFIEGIKQNEQDFLLPEELDKQDRRSDRM